MRTLRPNVLQSCLMAGALACFGSSHATAISTHSSATQALHSKRTTSATAHLDGRQPPGMLLDARRYFKKGSPSYVVADFVYVDHWNTGIGAVVWDDVIPGQYPAALQNDNSEGWFVTEDVNIQSVVYHTKSRATVQATIDFAKGYEDQMTMHSWQQIGTYTVHAAVQLKKIANRWWITNMSSIAKHLPVQG